MSKNSMQHDKEMAAHLKEIGAKRTTGTCPMGCGTAIPNGGERLIVHLNTCRGKRR
jgi:hypothetical protein